MIVGRRRWNESVLRVDKTWNLVYRGQCLWLYIWVCGALTAIILIFQDFYLVYSLLI